MYKRPVWTFSQEPELYISRSGWIVCVVRLAAVWHPDLGLAAAVRAFISGELCAVLPAEVTRYVTYVTGVSSPLHSRHRRPKAPPFVARVPTATTRVRRLPFAQARQCVSSHPVLR